MFDLKKFTEYVEEQHAVYSKFKKPLIVHHFDADGLTSGILCMLGFQALGIPYESLCVKRLDPVNLENAITIFNERECKELVFVDLGSGFTTELIKLKIPMLILDHHIPSITKDELLKHNIIQVNIMDFEGKGAVEVSASSTVYFAFKKFSESRFKPEVIGLLGAFGDFQHVNGFQGLNKIILDKALKEKIISFTNDLVLYGKNSRPLHSMLCYSTDPLLPGLTGNNDACINFVKSLGIDLSVNGKWNTYFDLTEEERKLFISKLFAYLLENDFTQEQLKKLLVPVFIINGLNKSSPFLLFDEFTTILNACGRNNQEEVGINLLKGIPGAEEKTLEILTLHRNNLKNAFSFAIQKVKDNGSYYLVDGRGVIADSIIGTAITSVLFSMKVKKPILGLSLDSGNSSLMKASGRLTKEMVAKGFSLGKVFSGISAKIGGQGGGHDIAAGITFDSSKANDLLELFKLECNTLV